MRSTYKHSQLILVLIRKVIVIYDIPLSTSDLDE